ncbi:MAG: S8 family serine peptidase, partial [bacterium]|nr:S8 family serine peptidase [bacterium]
DSLGGTGDSSGVISLNPNVRIVPIKIFPDSTTGSGATIEETANGITEAWSVYDADVISNSWGSEIPDWEWDVLNYALHFAYLNGRDGRGVPLIFSAGNKGYFWCINNIVAYPARLEACFAVAALKLNDSAWSYNTCGPEMDIAAPSGDINLQGGMWSLDQMDSVGYNYLDTSTNWDCPTQMGNDDDYDCHFGGTSGACPVVSGVASLILAKDTSLTAGQVYSILRNSAQTELDWGTVTPPDYQYGYGRVDAFRAILSLARGDADNSDVIDITDITFLVDWLWNGGADPFPSVLLGDCDCSGDVDATDLSYLVDYFFGSPYGPAPVKPCFVY